MAWLLAAWTQVCAGAEPVELQTAAKEQGAPVPDRVFIDQPPAVAAGPASAGKTGQLRLTTVPSGISFEILASAYETPNAKVLRSGITPTTVKELTPGAYRVRFNSPGIPPRSSSVQVVAGEETAFEQSFPHGLLKVRTQPAGAGVLYDGRLIGLAPATLPLLPGKHQISARWKGRTARTKTAQVIADRETEVSFDFTPRKKKAAPVAAAPSPKTKKKPGVMERTGRTLKKFYADTLRLLK